MSPENKLGLVLLAMLGAGLMLVAYGLGWSTKPAALVVGVFMAYAAIRMLSCGPHR